MAGELSGGLGFHPHDSNQLGGERMLLLVGLRHLRDKSGQGQLHQLLDLFCVTLLEIMDLIYLFPMSCCKVHDRF